MNKIDFINLNINQVIEEYPFMADYFSENENLFKDFSKSPSSIIDELTEEELEDLAIDKELTLNNYYEYFNQMLDFLGIEDDRVESLTIIKGYDKSGIRETHDLTINVGEVIAIVGPTGSGKSRLLADIEWIADEDTPTKRKILINNKEADKKWRFSSGNKIVAQLSQNMNFVMDLTVKEFLELHANSRLVEDVDNVVKKIIEEANLLAGETFDLETPITSLSGGQSRALMIADTAILSKSPIVLIDEIENAGIDRKKALDLLVKEEKIVLMATHDPILALMADKRIVIKNGGISKIIFTNNEEKQMLKKLEEVDKFLMKERQLIRLGQSIKLESLHID
ncbi:MAG: ABC transporter ATP-binding protein [Sphaerochaetaceae bacterium]|nr:ABC transporter ATP-binding protein [Sphaerochaetaceae bacterium]MDC7236260.1 ABC transporter ATP-binding protein [Sphaerochaetaceae bacterium]MDC7250296.1 ABC transporter ATP-binding protein [Sphaerochaetaceae bacterium]